MLNIGFVVDHPRRDLPGAVMVAHALARRGVRTSLIPLYDQAVDVPLLGLDALVINYARPANFDLVQGYHDMGLAVFVLDTEGGVLSEDGANSPHRLAAYVRDSGYAELLAGYLFWGPVVHRAFVEGSGMPAGRLHLTGCPRFDFASPRWDATLDHARSGYLLVNANFPLVNPLFARSPEAETAALVKAGWQPAYVGRLLADQRQILRGFVDTIGRLARALPQRSFLLRPHPFENAGLYRKAYAGQRNIIIDGRGSVLNVIRHAACVLHLNCATSVEATMLRRLPISMEFLNTEHMAGHSLLPSRVSWRAESQEALEAALLSLPEMTAGFDFARRYREHIHPWFYVNDGGAGERVADALLANILPGHLPDARQALARSLA
ncbi:MAG: hypothetical protein HGA47_15645, partial [Zoogloea sp.]|nr:hypothetical protein [Zoogloea sp.]